MIVFQLMMCTSHTEYLKPKLLNIFFKQQTDAKIKNKTITLKFKHWTLSPD